MKFNDIDLNLFVVMDAIYQESNLTRAGELIGITQPAVSNSLARLRVIFDDPLFVRTSGGMIPTPLARNIIRPIREALRLMRTSVQEATQFCAATSDMLFRISMTDLAEAFILPLLLKTLRHSAPGIRVESYVVNRREIALDLASGSIDLAIDAPVLNDPHLRNKLLFSEPQVCVMRTGHPQLDKTLNIAAYLELSHLHVSTRKKGLGQVDLELGKLGLQRHIALRTRHYMITPDILEQTDLVLTVPVRFAKQITERFDLAYRAFPLQIPPIESHLFWHESVDHDSANLWMRELLARLMAAYRTDSVPGSV